MLTLLVGWRFDTRLGHLRESAKGAVTVVTVLHRGEKRAGRPGKSMLNEPFLLVCISKVVVCGGKN